MKLTFLLFTLLLPIYHACDQSGRTALASCLVKKMGAHHSQKVSEISMAEYINSLGFAARIAMRRFGGVNRIMNECDKNNDRYVSFDEFSMNPETCLKECWKQKAIGYYTGC